MTDPNSPLPPDDESSENDSMDAQGFHDEAFHDDSLDAAMDAFLDGLLSEALGGSTPPDLTDTVLHRLRDERDHQPEPTPPPVVGVPVASPRSPSPVATSLGLLAVAASLLLAVAWFRSEQKPAPRRPDVGGNDFAVAPTPEVPAVESTPEADAVVDDRSIASDLDPDLFSSPMVAANEEPVTLDSAPTFRSLTTPEDSEGVSASPPSPSVDPERFVFNEITNPNLHDISEVQRQLDERFTGYWQSLGITPTPPRTPSDTAAFLRNKLGVRLDDVDTKSVSELKSALSASPTRGILAKGFLKELTNNGLFALSPEQQGNLIADFVSCLADGDSVGSLMAELVGREHENAELFYRAMSRNGRHGMVSRMAVVTMGQDVRCIRCHDALVESRGQQRDYWAFAGLLSGRKQGNRGNDKSDMVYFDTIDRRRAMSSVGVPAKWLLSDTVSRQDAEQIQSSMIDSIDAWSEALPRTRALARGLVGVVWEMIHDRPLHGSIVDAHSAPHDELLSEIERILCDDMLASEFDLTRTIALVVASPATHRSVPDSLLIENRWAVNADDEHAYAAFAASRPTVGRWPMAQRLELILATSGATFRRGDDGAAILAQPIPTTRRGTSAAETRKMKTERIETRDFPVGAPGMPVAWLTSVDDEASRLAHLCYLAGRSSVPAQVAEANAAMKDGEVPEPLRLSRVWWMIRP